MKIPLQITFKNMEASAALEARIREKAAKLDHFFEHVMGCHVTVEAPHRHHHQGKLYRVAVDLTVPQGELVVNREGVQDHAHEDVYVAVRDAFDAAARRLEDHVRRLRGDVKHHEVPGHGTVSRLFPEQGYGFVTLGDGTEVYFHRNAVLDEGFARLEEGSAVRVEVAEGEGEQGPQASTVRLIGKHHLVP